MPKQIANIVMGVHINKILFERKEDEYDNALIKRKKIVSRTLEQKENIQSGNSQFIQKGDELSIYSK
jgi:hypothetical protein